MSIVINSTEITPELSAQSVDFLLGNEETKLTIVHEIEYRNSTAAIANVLIANYTNGVVGGQWIFDPNGGFDNFKVGDTLEHKNYATNALGPPGLPITVLQKLSSSLIQIDQDITGGGGNDVTLGTSILNNLTPPTAVKYRYNFIENAESPNFISKVDPAEENRYIALGLDATDTVTVVNFTPLGQKSWQIGSASIVGDGLNTIGYYGFKFKITHTVFINPFFLKDQFTDLQNGVAPADFLGANCLKNITGLTGYRDYNDPNTVEQETYAETLGNTGWYNENFNTGLTNYSVSSIVYKDSLANIVPAAQLSPDITSVRIILENNINSPFVAGSTKFVLGFTYLPLDENQYQGNDPLFQANTKTIIQNFYYDRALQTEGSASVDGDNFGGNYQIIKNITAVALSGSQLQIDFEIDLATAARTYFGSLDEFNKNYRISVQIQDHTKPTITADVVTLIADVNVFYENATDPGMIIFPDKKYLRHFENDIFTEGTSSVDAFLEDEVVAFTLFGVDHNGRTVDQFGNSIEIQLMSVEAKIKVKNSSTLQEFTDDTVNAVNLSLYNIVSGDTFVQFSQPRQFHLPATEIRKLFEIKRRPAIDSGGISYYTVQFPFMVRWEYFLQQLNVDNDFFDMTEPFNGLNRNWFYHQTLLTDWKVYFELKVSARKNIRDAVTNALISNGDILHYTYEDQIALRDYEDKTTTYQAHTIKSFDQSGTTELYDSLSGKRFLLGYQNTLIHATFELTGGGVIDPAAVEGCMHIEAYEEGGRDNTYRISTINPHDNDTWFKSEDGSFLALKTLNVYPPLLLVGNNTITFSFLVDFTKIPLNKPIFKINARLYDVDSIMPLAKMTESGEVKITEDYDFKILEA